MKGRILIVEDHFPHRETLDRHLTDCGHVVLSVDTAEAALSSLAAFGPDLVITDIRLPGMSGFELFGHIQERAPEVDVVMITAFEVMQAAIDAMKRGAYDYLVKPLDLNRLEDVVSGCLQQRANVRGSDGAADDAWEGVNPDGRALLGRHPAMLEVYKKIGAVSRSRTPVLIRGETGTGKELIAHTIHANSPNAEQPFVAIDCTSIPATLLESELFGHVKGAFTGAHGPRKGRFELARSGTVFLDEIGDTDGQFQAKLLRVIQEKEFYPVGGEQSVQTTARVIAATHQPIPEMIEEGRFREDLYFRLKVIELFLPPLRERRSDIPLLVNYFITRASREVGRDVPIIPEDVRESLVSHDWPGNVRELQNAVTRAVVLAKGRSLAAKDLGIDQEGGDPGSEWTSADQESLASMERLHVQRVLAKEGGNKSRAARKLGVSRPRLDRIISRYDLTV